MNWIQDYCPVKFGTIKTVVNCRLLRHFSTSWEVMFRTAYTLSAGLPLTNDAALIKVPLVSSSLDLYHGARPEQLDKALQSTLNRILIPSSRTDVPILSNFFVAAKAANGDGSVARNQACYDSAFGARAMQISESLSMKRPYISGNARVISCTLYWEHVENVCLPHL